VPRRVNGDRRDLLRIAEAEVAPGGAAVVRAIDAVTNREIGALQPFAASDVEDVCVGGRDDQRPDRLRGLIVENRCPRMSGIGRLPHTTVYDSDIEGVRMAWVSGRRSRPAAAHRADVPPSQLGEQSRLDSCRLLRRHGRCTNGGPRHGNEQGAGGRMDSIHW
jgi:hypothetical protein